MIETPQIVKTSEELTAVIHLTIPRTEMRAAIPAALAEIHAAAAAQGIDSSGRWMAHHLTMHPDTFDFEVCVPVAAPIAPAGRVQPSRWPAMEVARTVYQGDYSNLHQAWAEFGDWIKAQGLPVRLDLWERYLVAPDSTSDPAHWRTELSLPLAA